MKKTYCRLRQRGGVVDQVLNGGDTLVTGADRADRLTDAVLKRGEVAGALVQRLRREEGGRRVQSRVDLVAGRQTGLGAVERGLRGLQQEEVAAD